jgi:hypothetical protein
VRNADVAATIRRYGAPAHSKPHGPDETILYYEDPAFVEAEQEHPEDFAGMITPGGRSLVEQIHLPRSALAGTAVSSTSRLASPAPQAGIGGRNEYASPNDLTRDSEIVNGVNKDIAEQEWRALEARDSLHDRDTVAGEGRPEANIGFFGGGSPFVGPVGGEQPSAARIEFLDDARRETIRKGLRSSDEGIRGLAADAVDQLLQMIPSSPAPSDEGTCPLSDAEVENGGGLGMGGKLDDEESEEELPEGAGTISSDVAPVGALTPRGELAEAHPEWNYAFLDAKSKEELEALATEAEQEFGVTVTRTDGKAGALRVADYIAALRTDQA